MAKTKRAYNGRGAFAYNRAADPYTATYDVAQNFASLIPPAQNSTRRVKSRTANLADTLTEMVSIVNQYRNQAARLAAVLAAKGAITPARTISEQSIYNVWHWLKTQIEYKLDKPGTEELRSPARSWADRYSGIDCDDYAIFAACLLANLGIPAAFSVVKFNSADNYSHVFVIATDSETGKSYVVDPVMSLFNELPPSISGTMNLDVLTGVPTDAGTLYGNLAGTALPEREYRELSPAEEDQQATLKAQWLELIASKNNPAELQTAQLIAPLVDINPRTGELVPVEGNLEDVVNVIALAELDQEQRLNGLGSIPLASEVFAEITASEMQGLGRRRRGGVFRRVAKGIKKTLKKAGEAIRETARDVSKGRIAKVLKGAGRMFMKVNPVGIAGRNAYLGLLKLNFRGHATAFSRNEESLKRFEKVWKNLGGNPEVLRRAVGQGKGKKPLFGEGRAARASNARLNANNRANPPAEANRGPMVGAIPYGEFSGLGAEPVSTATLIATATALIDQATKILKSLGIDLPGGEGQAVEDGQFAPFPDTLPPPSPSPSGGGGMGWLLPVGIGVAVVGGIALSKRKKRK